MKSAACCLLLFAAALSATTPVLADEEPGTTVTMTFKDEDVKHVVSMLAKSGGKNIIMSPDVKGRVTLALQKTPWLEALRQAAAAVDAVVTVEPHDIYRVTLAPATTDAAKAASPAALSISFTGEDVRNVIAAIAKAGQLNVIISPKVKGKITVRLHDVSPRVAIEQIAKTMGFAVVDEGVLQITPPQRAAAKRISLEVKGMAIEEVFATIAKRGGLNLILAPGIEGKVSATFESMPARDAVAQLCKAHGLTIREAVDGILRIEKQR